MTATQEQPSAKSWSVATWSVATSAAATSSQRQRRRRGCRRRRSRSRRTRSRWRSSGRRCGVGGDVLAGGVSPVAAPTISRTMKARTTHETICLPQRPTSEAPPRIPRSWRTHLHCRRQGSEVVPAGPICYRAGTTSRRKLATNRRLGRMSLTGHHPPCGSFRPPQGVGIALNVDPGPDRQKQRWATKTPATSTRRHLAYK